jgi:hypothetical protein
MGKYTGKMAVVTGGTIGMVWRSPKRSSREEPRCCSPDGTRRTSKRRGANSGREAGSAGIGGIMKLPPARAYRHWGAYVKARSLSTNPPITVSIRARQVI